MIRVAHVSRCLNMGGQERLLVEFARHADCRRFELIFISLTDMGPIGPRLQDLGWPVYALDTGEGIQFRLVPRLARFFKDQGIDVVHTHDDNPLLYGAPAARLARLDRCIHTHHHGFLPYRPPKWPPTEAWASYLTDAFVCVSQDTARYMLALGASPRRVCVLRNGIDLDRYAFQGPRADGPIVTVARLNPEKGIDDLIRAVAIARESAPDVRLEIAGEGPSQGELESLVSTLRLTEQVRFLGQVSDVAGLLSRARIFALGSHTEGISLTILEAMARGLPVVTTRVGGNPEVVVHETTGLLVPPRDPPALAESLLRLWRHGEDGALMGWAGRRRVEEHFDIRKMVAAYEALYEGRRPRPKRRSVAAAQPREI